MRIVPLFMADALLTDPVYDQLEKRGLAADLKLFPNMRSSLDVAVFSPGYLVAITEWWRSYQAATGFKYEPGSGMCESGVKVFCGHVEESLQPLRGVGAVPGEVLEGARRLGHSIPTDRMGDFFPAVYRVNLRIPAGVVINGVTDGGHSTVAIIVDEPGEKLVAYLWEWQNGQWVSYADKIAAGAEIVDIID